MNIKDLNLEDLVLYIDKEGEIETPCKINSLNSNGEWSAQILNSKFIFQGDNNECSVEECLRPIPLTPDILEKNDWILKEWNGHKQFQYTFNECGTDIILKIDYEVPNFLITCFREEISIRYVHELQHALILCEIDKEIVL